MKKLNWVGVDVGSRELVVAVERNGKRGETLSFENTAEGHRKLIHSITKRGASARVVLEATGVYGFDLALALERASRVEVMVANPRAVSHFGRASLHVDLGIRGQGSNFGWTGKNRRSRSNRRSRKHSESAHY